MLVPINSSTAKEVTIMNSNHHTCIYILSFFQLNFLKETNLFFPKTFQAFTNLLMRATISTTLPKSQKRSHIIPLSAPKDQKSTNITQISTKLPLVRAFKTLAVTALKPARDSKAQNLVKATLPSLSHPIIALTA